MTEQRLKKLPLHAKDQREALVVKEILTGLKELKLEEGEQLAVELDAKILLKEIGTELVQNVAIKKEIRQELESRLAEIKIEAQAKPEEPTEDTNKKEQAKSIESLAKEKQKDSSKGPQD